MSGKSPLPYHTLIFVIFKFGQENLRGRYQTNTISHIEVGWKAGILKINLMFLQVPIHVFKVWRVYKVLEHDVYLMFMMAIPMMFYDLS